MAGSFVGSNAAPPKMHVGKANRPKRTAEPQTPFPVAPEYPITDDFASESIPGFATRCANTNNKSGFNSVPGRPPSGRLAQRQGPVNRGAGKYVGSDETARDASNEERNKIVDIAHRD